MPWRGQTAEYALALFHAALAGFGGSMGYVMRSIDAGERVLWWRVLAEGAAAAFVGVIVMMLCQAMNFSPKLTGVVVGVCGWMGANAAISMLQRVVSRKIGADGDQEFPNEHRKPSYERLEVQDQVVDRVPDGGDDHRPGSDG